MAKSYRIKGGQLLCKLVRVKKVVMFAVMTSVIPLHAVADKLIDPTQPLFGAGSSSGSTEKALILESILIAGDRKVAVINGQSVTEGQTVSAAKVKKILPGKVFVLHHGKQKSLELMSPVITPNKAGVKE